MRIPYVKRVANDTLLFNAENLSNLSKLSMNATCDKDGNIKYYGYTDTQSDLFTKTVRGMAKVGEKIFCYTEKNKLFYIENLTVVDTGLTILFVMPTILEIVKNGEHLVLVLDENGTGYTIDSEGNTMTYSFPIGRVACTYNGMLFIAHLNELYFSAPMDCTNFTMNLNEGGVIKTDKNDGNIVSLVVQDNKLLVFTTRAIYEFTAFGERIDYTLKKIETTVPSVRMFSAKNCGKKTLFISGDKLCSYENRKITEINSMLSRENLVIKGNPAVDKKAYYIPVSDSNGNRRILRYDTENDTECLIDCDYSVISDGGYTMNKNGMLIFIEENGELVKNYSFTSKVLDFGTAKDKVIHEISMICDAAGILTVHGDCGERTFTLKKGSNVKRMNIPSNSFTLTFSGGSKFNAQHIKIKYRIKGE